MKIPIRAKRIITNILIAAGISLLVNFADMLSARLSMQQFLRFSTQFHNQFTGSSDMPMDTVQVQGRTYVIPKAFNFRHMRRDSTSSVNARLMDSLTALKPFVDSLMTHVRESAAQNLADTSLPPESLVSPSPPEMRDRENRERRTGRGFMPAGGSPFGFGANRGPTRDFSWISDAVKQSAPFQTKQFLYFFLLGFMILSVAVYRTPSGKKQVNYFLRLFTCLLLAVGGYFLAPSVAQSGEVLSTFRFSKSAIYDTTLLLKCALVFVVAALYGKIYELTTQRQKILLENEKLKSENLQATYSTLINQMNPHFFFNSLNSLSMLVREKHNTQALKYIDRLSDTFRYILQNGASGMISLEEELKFTDAYKYLLEVRYEGKLFVDVNVDQSYMQWTLPSFTLQPLIENAVKHNSITRSEPLHITINSNGDDTVSVSNTVNPRMDSGGGTGIGLSNLSERYRLLTGEEITIIHNNREFTVILPLIPPRE